MNQKQSWNIIVLFLVLIFGFSAASALKPQRSFSEKENRSLSMRPGISLQSVLSGEFEQDYEDYLKDQFLWRDQWIALRTRAEKASLKQEVHDVYFAKDHYLIEKHTGVFDTETAQANAELLGTFMWQISEQYGNRHVTAVIVPNAVSVLTDKLPRLASPYPEQLYLRKIRDAVPDECWIDAQSVLSAHQDKEIFYKTDHHWTTLGAFYVFQEWASSRGFGEVRQDTYSATTVTEDFEGTVAAKVGIKVRPDRIVRYNKVNESGCTLVYNQSDDVRSTLYQDTKLDTRNKYDYFLGGNYGLIEITNRSNILTRKRVLIIKDSYAHCFAPFVIQYADEVDLLDLRYYNESVKALLESKDYTDILFLYNAAGFAEDPSLSKLMM